MHSLILLAIAGAALAALPSGYENAEVLQPAPLPVSSDGGDQQGYNNDAGSQVPQTVPVAPADLPTDTGAAQSPPLFPPAPTDMAPAPPPPPAPTDMGPASPPPSDTGAEVPPRAPVPTNGETSSNGGGYRHRLHRAHRLH
ncbi:hypothetical protein TELCIR_11380 [Teladorsagia circumcincta]|uniref:Uncharacterized protein n=1 Tax=Teladorsagia circumcincta TaxID=45464 RepID=A0A2G9U9G5_TELCI|nr:hypothetical protein TELCIR_11380 [Teladorsagia circumcincta]